MAIYRYPLQAPEERGSASTADGATEAIDYACFQRTSVKYDDKGFRGYSLPGSNSVKRELNDDRVYLAMPKGLQTSYTPSYRQIELGAAGAAAIQAIADGDGSTEAMAAKISDTAKAVLPEFASGAFAGAINSAAQMAGLQGGVDANSLQALTRGRVFNPFKENVFSGINFRTHTFNFKLAARSEQEAKEMQSILNYFKEGSVPNIGSADKSDGGTSGAENLARSLSGNRFFTVPDSFNIKFIRLRPDGSTDSEGDKDFMHFRIHPSVCTNIQVNYTPDGQYTSFKSPDGDATKSIQVPAITLALTFTETKLITTVDINQGF